MLKFFEVHGPYGWPISISIDSLEAFLDGPLSILNLSKALDFPSCAHGDLLIASMLKFFEVHGPYGWPISISIDSLEAFLDGPLSILNLSKALDFPSCAQGDLLMASMLKFFEVHGPYGWAPLTLSTSFSFFCCIATLSKALNRRAVLAWRWTPSAWKARETTQRRAN